MTRQKYEGILAEPILATEEHIQAAFLERVDALYEHYGIDREDPVADFKLAMALARKHVPGMQLKKLDARWPDGQRRPGPLEAACDLHLISQMRSRIDNGHSVKRAAELYVEKNPLMRFKSPAAARQRYLQLSGDGPRGKSASANLERLSQSANSKES